MRKRLYAGLLAIVLTAALIAAGVWYYGFVTRTIYKESVAHLTEIYHLANQSLHNLVSRNWSMMHMWASYFEDVQDDGQAFDFSARRQDEVGFTVFFFVSR